MLSKLVKPSGFIVVTAAILCLAFSADQDSLAEDEKPAPAAAVSSSTDLPDAPGFTAQASSAAQSTPPAQTANPDPSKPQQTKRILGIMPNFNAVSADTILPPQTPKEKFVIAAKNSFDYSSFLIAAIQSGVNFANDSYPEFGHGAEGFGKYYYHNLLDTADENFMVAGLYPVLFHQDNRYYTLGHGGFRKRALYAATRVLITRRDNGHKTFNASEIIGAGSAAGISSLYYPEAYRDWTKIGQKWLTSVIIDAANFTFIKEFWPDVNKRLSRIHQPKP